VSASPELPKVRELLDKYGLRAKKSWGQNFLTDEAVYRKITEATIRSTEDAVIEIGAGLGTLTARLAVSARRVVAIERDRDMIAVLRGELGENSRVEIAEANALSFDYGATAQRLGGSVAAVGNLPYQIASQILFRLLDARTSLDRMVVMVQKEMADRIVARPDTEDYGALSVMVQMYGRPKLVCRVGSGAFVPPPRVQSAVVAIEPYDKGAARVTGVDERSFSLVVHAAFNQRRKTLRNALTAGLSGSERADDAAQAKSAARAVTALERAGIDPGRRGETLSVEEFAEIAVWLDRGDR
jgi:16S rRNA (adenine1518-N6/adenine1519-N6)-dimethyltransferase